MYFYTTFRETASRQKMLASSQSIFLNTQTHDYFEKSSFQFHEFSCRILWLLIVLSFFFRKQTVFHIQNLINSKYRFLFQVMSLKIHPCHRINDFLFCERPSERKKYIYFATHKVILQDGNGFLTFVSHCNMTGGLCMCELMPKLLHPCVVPYFR